jgi:SPP1 family predicted phage head-tail adaptor
MNPILNTELVLEEPQRISDGGGGFTTEWKPIGTLWAEVASVRAGERLAGERDVATATHRITIRNAPQGSPRRPRASCRFRSGSRTFAIHGVAPADLRGKYLSCWVVEDPFG